MLFTCQQKNAYKEKGRFWRNHFGRFKDPTRQELYYLHPTNLDGMWLSTEATDAVVEDRPAATVHVCQAAGTTLANQRRPRFNPDVNYQ